MPVSGVSGAKPTDASDTTRGMDKATYDETVTRLKAVNKVVKELAPEIRVGAWEVLAPYVKGGSGSGAADGANDTGKTSRGGGEGKQVAGKAASRTPQPLDEDALLDQFASEHDAQSNGLLVAAIMYGKYGNGPYAPKELSDLGEEHRLPMPRMGNFLRRTKRDEKKLFRNGKDGWMITSDGAKWLSAEYGIKRGTSKRPE